MRSEMRDNKLITPEEIARNMGPMGSTQQGARGRRFWIGRRVGEMPNGRQTQESLQRPTEIHELESPIDARTASQNMI